MSTPPKEGSGRGNPPEPSQSVDATPTRAQVTRQSENPHTCVSCGDSGQWQSPTGHWVCDGCRDYDARKDGFRLTNSATVKPEKVEWLIDGRIPLGSLSILAGVGGLGKSTLSVGFAASVTTGRNGREPADVIIATTEDSLAHTIVPRLIAAGADLRRVSFLAIVEKDSERGLTLPDDAPKLAAAIQRTGAELVILDPVVGHISESIDSHKDHSVRRALGPLHDVAEATGAAILGIGHLNKGTSTDAMMRLGGSVAFGNAARSVMFFIEDPTKGDGAPDRVLVHHKSNVSVKASSLRFLMEPFTIEVDGETIPTSRLVYDGEDHTITVADSLRGDADEHSLRGDAKEVILGCLEDGPKPWKTIVKATRDEGISDRTAQRGRDDLKRSGVIDKKVDGFRGPWLWHLATPSQSQNDGQVGQDWESGQLLDLAKESRVSHVNTHLATKKTPENGGQVSDDPVHTVIDLLEAELGAVLVTNETTGTRCRSEGSF